MKLKIPTGIHELNYYWIVMLQIITQYKASMVNTFKMFLMVLFLTFLMPFGLTLSFAYGHGGGGY